MAPELRVVEIIQSGYDIIGEFSSSSRRGLTFLSIFTLKYSRNLTQLTVKNNKGLVIGKGSN